MNIRFPDNVVAILKRGGWHDGRSSGLESLATSSYAPPRFEAALSVLSEFGGLHVGECGPGIDSATSDVEINPGLTMHLTNEIEKYSIDGGTQMYAVGEYHNGHGYLVLDECGNTYILSDEMEKFSDSFDKALVMLLLGISDRKI